MKRETLFFFSSLAIAATDFHIMRFRCNTHALESESDIYLGELFAVGRRAGERASEQHVRTAYEAS